jgi:hypothetical protein
MGVEDPRTLPDEVEHPWLLLRDEQQRLHHEGRAERNHCLKFLEDTLRIGEIRDYKSGHVGQGRDSFNGRFTAWLLEIKQHGQIVASAELFSNRFENDGVVSLAIDAVSGVKRPRINTTLEVMVSITLRIF